MARTVSEHISIGYTLKHRNFPIVFLPLHFLDKILIKTKDNNCGLSVIIFSLSPVEKSNRGSKNVNEVGRPRLLDTVSISSTLKKRFHFLIYSYLLFMKPISLCLFIV